MRVTGSPAGRRHLVTGDHPAFSDLFLASEPSEPRSGESVRTALLGHGAVVAAVAVIMGPSRYGATGSRSPRGSSASCSRNGSTAARHPSGWS